METGASLSAFAMAAGFLGGLGLFLLGMALLTDGLKLAGGRALHHILGTWTRTRLRALVSGITVTALVQSSSAVTVATIGFANAGLLTLSQSIWVIFGSNVGTTMTGWLVALIGFNLKIEAFALPAIGVGALFYLFLRRVRPRHLGLALAGFGLLFLGIDVLQNAFAGLSQQVDLAALARPGLPGILMMVALGALLTVLMQSSSASIAMALTATMSGAVPIEAAAAAVIGANLGTTVKALLVTIGATANARRVAIGHVIFNGLTAVVAVLILPWFLTGIAWVYGSTAEAPSPAVLLALFHTAFNLLGVLLMAPLAPFLVRWLNRRFRAAEDDIAQPRFLDRNLTAVPDLALQALLQETRRLGDIGYFLARDALQPRPALQVEEAGSRMEAANRLLEHIIEFAAATSRGHLPEQIQDDMASVIRIARYHRDVAQLAHEIAELRSGGDLPLISGHWHERIDGWRQLALRWLDLNHLEPEEDGEIHPLEDLLNEVLADYQRLKQQLLGAGTRADLSLEAMDRHLTALSLARRVLFQADKARRLTDALHGGATASPPSPAPNNQPANDP
jgi:phosphate:Na+ symporter